MLSALLYLRLTSLRNRVVSALKRMRNPKYLLGALVGAAYFYFFLIRRFPASGGRNQALTRLIGDPGAHARLITVAGSAVLMAMFALQLGFSWISPAAQPGLRFSEAEIAFLFPAPFTRRRLIHFNLLSSQLSVILSSLFFTLISNRWSIFGGNAATHAVGWCVIFSAIMLCNRALSLSAARGLGRGPGREGRRFAALAVAGLLAAALLSDFWKWVSASFAPSVFLQLFDGGAMHWVLLPFTWLVGPFVAADWRAFLLSLPPAAGLLAVLYFIVLRFEVSFEEGSIAQAERRAQARKAVMSGAGGASVLVKTKARKDPFPLRAAGRPEMAFLWKNLIAVRGWFSLRLILRLTLVAAVLALISQRAPHSAGSHAELPLMVLVVSAMASGYALILGPQLVRQDMRNDLPNADLLKMYPLEGWQVVTGEILAPAAILTCILWLTLLAASWALSRLTGQGPDWLTYETRVTGIACAAVLIPPLCAMQLLVPNAAALVFPAWTQLMRGRAAGIEAFGQRMIFLFGQITITLVALAPGALCATVIILASSWIIGVASAMMLATLAALVLILAEVWVGLWWMGGRFERLDIASDLTGR